MKHSLRKWAAITLPIPAEFIRDDDKWPCWPRLPMIKRDPLSGQLAECAVITPIASDGTITLYHANMYETIHANTRITKYPSVEALLADGWIIN